MDLYVYLHLHAIRTAQSMRPSTEPPSTLPSIACSVFPVPPLLYLIPFFVLAVPGEDTTRPSIGINSPI